MQTVGLARVPRPTAATPQGLRTRNSTFQKQFTEKHLVLKLFELSSAESCTFPDYFLLFSEA